MTSTQILSIIQDINLDREFRQFLQDSDEFSAPISCFLGNWYDEYNFDEDEAKVLALMEHTGDDYWDCYNSIDSNYLVYTEYEADIAWDESLDNYLDECVLPELPETAKQYFDRDSWISDARMDGRGHSLASYDGHKHEATIAGTTYYIYRIN